MELRAGLTRCVSRRWHLPEVWITKRPDCLQIVILVSLVENAPPLKLYFIRLFLGQLPRKGCLSSRKLECGELDMNVVDRCPRSFQETQLLAVADQLRRRSDAKQGIHWSIALIKPTLVRRIRN